MQSMLQAPILIAHWLSVALLLGFGYAWRKSPCGAALLIIAVASSFLIGTATLLIAVFLLCATFFGGHIVPPMAPALAFLFASAAYIILGVTGLRIKPRDSAATAKAWALSLAILPLFNGIFFWLLPEMTVERVVLQILSADSQPVRDATLNYTTKFQGSRVSSRSDVEGRITIPVKLGDSEIQGEVVCEGFSKTEIYLNPRKGAWIVFRRWPVTFGSSSLVFVSLFIETLSDVRSPPVTVFLLKPESPALLPYSGLQGLAPRLEAAHRTGQAIHRQDNTLELYIQVPQAAEMYERNRLPGYPAVFANLKLANEALNGILKGLADQKQDLEIRDRGLTDMMNLLQIPDGKNLTSQEKQHLIKSKLDADIIQIDAVLDEK